MFVVHQQYFDAQFTQFDTGSQTCRSATDDQYWYFNNLWRVHARGIVNFWQGWQAIGWLNPHIGRHQFHARLDGFAICNNHALCTLSVGAKNALRRAVVGMVTKHTYSIGKEGRRNRITSQCLERLSLPEKGNLFSFRNRQNRVLLNPMISHIFSLNLYGEQR